MDLRGWERDTVSEHVRLGVKLLYIVETLDEFVSLA